MHYDLNKDRSEEFDYKKITEEYIPTEEEQNLWSKITIIFSVVFVAIAFIGRQYGIFG